MLGKKGQVAVIEMEIGPDQAPSAVASMEMFRQTLKKQGVTIARTKRIPGGLTALVMGVGISRNDYVAVVEGSPSVEAVITFAGLPVLPPDELHQFQQKHPPLFVVDIFGTLKGPNLPELIEQKTVAVAFLPRTAAEVAQQGKDAGMFDRYYRILRPAAR